MSPKTCLLASVAVFALVAGAGCQDEAKADLTKITPEAREIFKTRCALCHGESGRGDGVNAATLNPKPRNYTDRAWQKRISNDEIKRTIVLGGAGTGKSPMMTPNPDLADKPEVVEGLVAIVRSFGQQ